MNKYIPKVGEAFEWRGVEVSTWFTANKCICETRKAFGYECDNGWISTVNKLCEFRPIQTKCDVEREQLLDIMNKIFYGKDIHKIHAVQEIQNLNFTIPKKIKRSELKKIINHHHGDSAVSYTKTVDILICKLLGDLVEQDQGGDV
jgi:hypothetical protein